MKKKRGYKFMLIIYCFLMIIGTAVGYSAYTINNKDIVGLSSVTKPDANKNLNKVIFKDGDNGPVVDTVYVPSGEAIDSSNTPTIGSNRIKWHENNASGAVKLDLCDKNLKSFTPSNANTTLVAERVQPSNNISSGITNNVQTDNPNNPNGTTTTNITNNKVDLTQNGTIADKNKVCNDITIGGSFDKVNLDSKFKDKGNSDVIENDIFHGLSGEYQANGDETIGLEDPASPKTMYKPNAGGNGINYCVSRITLSSDLIITNSTFNIGAMVGFFGNATNWSQRNMQGFIIGNYSEVDLNGHNLIVGAGGNLNAYGSITDSSPDRSGRVIIENGGNLKSTFTVELQNFEKGLAISYYGGGQLFDSYRCPYLDCNLRIKHGGRFTGVMMLDFGGGNDNAIKNNIPFIGPDRNFLLTTGSGYVDRNVNYDKNVYNLNNSFANSNIMSQVISYEFHDCNDMFINNINVSVTISGVPFDIHFFKTGFVVAPYFNYGFYNSYINVPCNITYLPGSSLFVDKNSTINFTSTVLDKNHVTNFPGVAGLVDYLYQIVGGLTFAEERRDYKEPNSTSDNASYDIGWVDNVHDSKGNGSNGSTSLIHMNATNLHKYYNQHRRAHCDMLGTFTFQNIDSFNANSIYHHLGGEINIQNVETFKNTVASRNDVKLYASQALYGPCTAFGGLFGQQSYSVTDFFTSPLVSNGNVLMDANNQGKVRNDYKTNVATYDKGTGLVSYNDKKYAFIHTDQNYTNWDGDMTHSQKSFCGELHGLEVGFERRKKNYLNGKDSNFGKFFEVTENPDHSVHAPVNASGKNNYIFFRGAFMPYDGTNVYIDKLRGAEANLKQKGTVRSAKYITNDGYYDHPVWRLRK